ncbi:Uncharacterised protein [Brevundimonas diminuta]|uniref:hypothetical protein n=1 Tax=Brevundimonas diminuta TaxID=293 RepID=UPI000D95899F|nr:hypothetical protein [Brevundimonas diminuta]SPU43568.1 Uncharacterised protein [Brevundimonas diminuta]
MPLDLFSEPFAPSGGLAGDGARRLLGTPSLTQLQTLLREAGQNSWDARKGEAIRICIRVRTLTDEETAVLQGQVFADMPVIDDETDLLLPLRNAGSTPVRVLEIADFGTWGLSGPTRADIRSDTRERDNFVNLVRNIGARRDIELGGGTYGYGKMSLFAASQCSTILLDSLAVSGESVERRLIATHVGNEFADADDHRHTGRHWWGVSAGGTGGRPTYVDPVIGPEAETLATSLGLPHRGEEDTGTTVLIVLPDLDEHAVADMREALLWYFWPKMLRRDGAPPPIAFELWDEGEKVVIPPPAQFPPLDLYVEAYESLKRNEAGTREIRVGAGQRLTGKLAIRRGFRGDRSAARKDGLIPHTSAAVALMRPVELVVKYLEGTEIGNDLQEWAGVFIVDSDQEIEKAFAASEPPAHDDWIPDSLTERNARMYVNRTLGRIRQYAYETIFPQQIEVTGDRNQPPLAKAAARLGQLLPFDPELPGPVPDRPNVGRRRRWQIEPPEFVSLEPAGDEVDALFLVAASNSSTETLRITASPGLVMDDRLTTETRIGGSGVVRVIDWRSGDGILLAEGPQLVVQPRSQVAARVRVRVPGLAAVGLAVTAAD